VSIVEPTDELLPLAHRPPRPDAYRCPGESYDISRAVHLGRLTAFYPACEHCPHRHEAESLGPAWKQHRTQVPRQAHQSIELVESGIRGRYLNDLDPQRAQQWAMVVAETLWSGHHRRAVMSPSETTPDSSQGASGLASDHIAAAGERLVRSGTGAGSQTLPQARRRAPTVVVAYDERPSSPLLAAGVFRGLRQMGCRVVDVGLLLTSQWRTAMGWLAADGGLMVTGYGSESAWTGLDLAEAGGAPVSPQQLQDWRARLRQPCARPTRRSGTMETLDVATRLRESLRNDYHALRPLRVSVATASAAIWRSLPALFAPLPCTLQPVLLGDRQEIDWSPTAALHRDNAASADVTDRSTQSAHADVTLLIERDGAGTRWWDDCGQAIPAERMGAWLLQKLTVLNGDLGNGFRAATSGHLRLDALDHQCWTLCRQTGQPVWGQGGRLWLQTSPHPPVCDAFRTLGKVLQALSLSDVPLSQQWPDRVTTTQ
jgi:phosphomannomutase